ncbi:alpha/beta fold hydrolase [Pseudonocardia xinjiangensis]|uniref:alpha/beta hydrolase n=1 Tax=Pseudonocardia xinjiangensis TaxID=75289 RepID=UPI003D8BDD1F
MLIGMGGSGKPGITYTFDDQARYLDAWFDTLGLASVVLLGHDWGGALAFDWAARHPGRVRGVAFADTIVKPMSWRDLAHGGRELLRSIITPGIGHFITNGPCSRHGHNIAATGRAVRRLIRYVPRLPADRKLHGWRSMYSARGDQRGPPGNATADREVVASYIYFSAHRADLLCPFFLTEVSVTLPSLLLVPGAWHKPAHLRYLIDELDGVDVHTVALASTGEDLTTLGDMYSDAAAIRAAAEAIDGPLVVLAHSYGGVPTTQALAGLSNVRRIVYLAAFLLDEGDSLLSSAGGTPPPFWVIHEQDGDAQTYITANDPAAIFYRDVDPAVAEQAVADLGYMSYLATTQPLTEVAWKEIPSTYILCESDDAVPPFVQELFAKRTEKVLRSNTSHSPFLSQPAALAQMIKDELASV